MSGDTAELAWCVEDTGEALVLYPGHDWVDWQERPDHLPVQPDRHIVRRLRWCTRCPKFEAEREGPPV